MAWEDHEPESGHAQVLWAGLSRWGKYCWGPLRAGGGRGPNVDMDQDRTCVVVWHAVYIEGGRLQFRRLDELVQASAKLTLPADRSEEINTSFLERRAVPFVLTTTDDGAALSGRRETARGFVYRPRADQRIVSNMSKALIQRRKVRESLSTGVNAGARVDIAGKPHVVITAAHVVEQQDEETGQGGDQFTQLWLGELSK